MAVDIYQNILISQQNPESNKPWSAAENKFIAIKIQFNYGNYGLPLPSCTMSLPQSNSKYYSVYSYYAIYSAAYVLSTSEIGNPFEPSSHF